MQLIKLEVIRPLVRAGAIKDASIVGQKGGYAVVFNVGMEQQTLGTRAGGVRLFTSTDTIFRTLRDLGIRQFSVDTSKYEEGALRRRRPDVSKRLNSASAASEALEHDQWFRAKVQKSLNKIEDGTAVFVGHDEMWGRLEAHTRARVAERDATKTKPTSGKRKAG
jgi:hypothetical protein